MTQSFPYSSKETVNVLFPQGPQFGAGGFSASSKPNDSVVFFYLNMTASAVDMALNQAGYYLPLEPIEGETWPVSQSYFMDYLTGLGTVGLIGNTLRPAPSMGPGSDNSPGNIFYQQYITWISRISSGNMGLRAKYRIGSPAERFLMSPRGPLWSFEDSDVTDMADVVDFWNSAFEEEATLAYIQSGTQSFRWP
jgi:hypothetical protein